MSRPRVVHVEIHGQKYAVRSELDSTYVVELAAFVDQKMRLAADEVLTGDPLRVSVVAALNIADELFRRRSESPNAEERFLSRTAEIERMIDGALDSVRGERIHAEPGRRESA